MVSRDGTSKNSTTSNLIVADCCSSVLWWALLDCLAVAIPSHSTTPTATSSDMPMAMFRNDSDVNRGASSFLATLCIVHCLLAVDMLGESRKKMYYVDQKN